MSQLKKIPVSCADKDRFSSYIIETDVILAFEKCNRVDVIKNLFGTEKEVLNNDQISRFSISSRNYYSHFFTVYHSLGLLSIIISPIVDFASGRNLKNEQVIAKTAAFSGLQFQMFFELSAYDIDRKLGREVDDDPLVEIIESFVDMEDGYCLAGDEIIESECLFIPGIFRKLFPEMAMKKILIHPQIKEEEVRDRYLDLFCELDKRPKVNHDMELVEDLGILTDVYPLAPEGPIEENGDTHGDYEDLIEDISEMIAQERAIADYIFEGRGYEVIESGPDAAHPNRPRGITYQALNGV